MGATAAQRKKWWRPTTVSEYVAIGMIIVIICSLLLFLSGGRIAIQSWWDTKGLKFSPSNNKNRLDGLISPNFDKESCLSRYESVLYRKTFPHAPSPHLLQKLRSYEALHKKCAPGTPLYKKSIEQLKLGHSAEPMECNYVVWIPHNGLGNRILSLTSTFLYAILTNRVMLIQQTDEMVDLFCEPFPDTSWYLPPDFPITDIQHLYVNSNLTYGNMLDNHVISNDPETTVESMPSYVYVHLVEDYHSSDRLFFCNDDQLVLGKVNWLLLRSDLYYAPSLYSTPLFEEELGRLFPAKTSTFYLLANYLLHPSNTVWELVTRYYKSYLANADERIGVQIRVFHFTTVSSDVISQQIMKCSKIEGILPEIDSNRTRAVETSKPKSKAILVVSLYSEYYEMFKSMYYEHAVKNGEIVSVYQPSHEGVQNTEKQSHNQKALAEIYLLSLCDVLMTSGWSTFGYVSTGMAGIKPVISTTIWGNNIPDTPCFRENSMEPCHLTPPNPSCKGKTIDERKKQQYMKPCQDDLNGIKLFDQMSN